MIELIIGLILLTIGLTPLFAYPIIDNAPNKVKQLIENNRKQFYMPMVISLMQYQYSCRINPKYTEPLLKQYVKENLEYPYEVSCKDLLEKPEVVKNNILTFLANKWYAILQNSYDSIANRLKSILNKLFIPLVLAIISIAVFIKRALEENSYQLYFLVSILIPIGIALLINYFYIEPLINNILSTLVYNLIGISPFLPKTDLYFWAGLILTLLGIALTIAVYYYLKEVLYAL